MPLLNWVYVQLYALAEWGTPGNASPEEAPKLAAPMAALLLSIVILLHAIAAFFLGFAMIFHRDIPSAFGDEWVIYASWALVFLVCFVFYNARRTKLLLSRYGHVPKIWGRTVGLLLILWSGVLPGICIGLASRAR